CHRDLKQAPRVRAVIDFLREAVRGEDARFVPPYVTAAGPARRTRADV
ncbi:LysR family transcriptional regulator, partial [Rhizobium ruizarguesonis]